MTTIDVHRLRFHLHAEDIELIKSHKSLSDAVRMWNGKTFLDLLEPVPSQRHRRQFGTIGQEILQKFTTIQHNNVMLIVDPELFDFGSMIPSNISRFGQMYLDTMPSKHHRILPLEFNDFVCEDHEIDDGGDYSPDMSTSGDIFD